MPAWRLVFRPRHEEHGPAAELSSSPQTAVFSSFLVFSFFSWLVYCIFNHRFSQHFKIKRFLIKVLISDILWKKKKDLMTPTLNFHIDWCQSDCPLRGGAGEWPRRALKCLSLCLFMNRTNLFFHMGRQVYAQHVRAQRKPGGQKPST